MTRDRCVGRSYAVARRSIWGKLGHDGRGSVTFPSMQQLAAWVPARRQSRRGIFGSGGISYV